MALGNYEHVATGFKVLKLFKIIEFHQTIFRGPLTQLATWRLPFTPGCGLTMAGTTSTMSRKRSLTQGAYSISGFSIHPYFQRKSAPLNRNCNSPGDSDLCSGKIWRKNLPSRSHVVLFRWISPTWLWCPPLRCSSVKQLPSPSATESLVRSRSRNMSPQNHKDLYGLLSSLTSSMFKSYIVDKKCFWLFSVNVNCNCKHCMHHKRPGAVGSLIINYMYQLQ